MEEPDAVDVTGPSEDGSAAVVVLARLRAQVDELARHDPGVRRNAPDAVHRMRVASRRLRSALASFRPLLDTGTADQLRGELRWLAQVLGEARDAEVMRERLTAIAAAVAGSATGESEGLPGTVRARLDAGYERARAQVLDALDSPRYDRLRKALDGLVEAPPWGPSARLAAREVLPALARADWKRLKARVAAADQAAGELERDLELHEVRKAGKRLRYACEALVPAFGHQAAETAAAAERLQEVLGSYQDSVVSQDRLRELAIRQDTSEGDALVLGRLHQLELEHAEQSRSQYQDAWAELSRKQLRRWMRT